ncbi:MAG TPA: MucR family transcriptional regulator [Allosphingosinicella sp.]|jgi:predicted transcriptional regulator
MEPEQLIALTADIVAAHVANNRVGVGEVSELVTRVHGALAALGSSPGEPAEEKPASPAVSVRSSIKPDYLICLACGRKQKTLKRHLETAHQLDPQQYRAQYGLSRDYPMVAPNYAQQRREMAHAIGLGRKPNAKRRGGKPAEKPVASPKRRRPPAK